MVCRISAMNDYSKEVDEMPKDVSSDSEDSEIEEYLYSQVHYASNITVDQSSSEKTDKINLNLSYPEVILGNQFVLGMSENNEKTMDKRSTFNAAVVGWDVDDLDRDDFGTPSSKKQGSRYYFCSSKFLPDFSCYNCQSKGHLSRDCPQPKKLPVCHLCGGPHLHYSCKNVFCFNCMDIGHKAKECLEPRKRFWTYHRCSRCKMQGHLKKDCPEIWRQYHITTVESEIIKSTRKLNRRKFCYNCASSQHLGEDCEGERFSNRTYFSHFVVSYDKCQVSFTNKREAETRRTCLESEDTTGNKRLSLKRPRKDKLSEKQASSKAEGKTKSSQENHSEVKAPKRILAAVKRTFSKKKQEQVENEHNDEEKVEKRKSREERKAEKIKEKNKEAMLLDNMTLKSKKRKILNSWVNDMTSEMNEKIVNFSVLSEFGIEEDAKKITSKKPKKLKNGNEFVGNLDFIPVENPTDYENTKMSSRISGFNIDKKQRRKESQKKRQTDLDMVTLNKLRRIVSCSDAEDEELYSKKSKEELTLSNPEINLTEDAEVEILYTVPAEESGSVTHSPVNFHDEDKMTRYDPCSVDETGILAYNLQAKNMRSKNRVMGNSRAWNVVMGNSRTRNVVMGNSHTRNVVMENARGVLYKKQTANKKRNSFWNKKKTNQSAHYQNGQFENGFDSQKRRRMKPVFRGFKSVFSTMSQ